MFCVDQQQSPCRFVHFLSPLRAVLTKAFQRPTPMKIMSWMFFNMLEDIYKIIKDYNCITYTNCCPISKGLVYNYYTSTWRKSQDMFNNMTLKRDARVGPVSWKNACHQSRSIDVIRTGAQNIPPGCTSISFLNFSLDLSKQIKNKKKQKMFPVCDGSKNVGMSMSMPVKLNIYRYYLIISSL